MVENTDLSHEELVTLREEQACKVQPMGHHEIVAYRGGMPPGERCIATPEALRTRLEDAVEEALGNGETGFIHVAFSPLSLALEKLDEMLPDFVPAPDLGSLFTSSSGPNNDVIAQKQDSIMDFTKG